MFFLTCSGQNFINNDYKNFYNMRVPQIHVSKSAKTTFLNYLEALRPTSVQRTLIASCHGKLILLKHFISKISDFVA